MRLSRQKLETKKEESKKSRWNENLERGSPGKNKGHVKGERKKNSQMENLQGQTIW